MFTDDTILGEKKSFRGWMALSEMLASDPVLWTRLHRIYMEGR